MPGFENGDETIERASHRYDSGHRHGAGRRRGRHNTPERARSARSRAEVLPPDRSPIEERRLVYGSIISPSSERLDVGFLAYMPSPRSYTGEDVVELHCHGGPLLLREVLSAVVDSGARAAGAGEFTKRAFLNGKLDLSQAEAVIDLIRAQTSLSLSSARGRLEGGLSRRVGSIKAPLLSLLAHMEAELDFTEEEIDGLPSEAIALNNPRKRQSAARQAPVHLQRRQGPEGRSGNPHTRAAQRRQIEPPQRAPPGGARHSDASSRHDARRHRRDPRSKGHACSPHGHGRPARRPRRGRSHRRAPRHGKSRHSRTHHLCR